MSSTTSNRQQPVKKLLLGCIASLEKRNSVVNVKFAMNSSVSKHEIAEWEQKHTCTLPEDLNAFYQTMDGLSLNWSAKLCDAVIPLGHMQVHRLEFLAKVQISQHKDVLSVLDGVFDDEDDWTSRAPTFDSRSRIFELDNCDGAGKVCLVYMNTKSGVPASESSIWFMDRALGWHYMADDFTTYYRLMLAHLGLPQWQYTFTDLGISPQVKQWFNVFAPLRLEMTDSSDCRPAAVDNTDNITVNQIDFSRVFKGKSEKKKAASTSAPAGQKKKPVPGQAPGKSAASAPRSSVTSLQTLSSKSRT